MYLEEKGKASLGLVNFRQSKIDPTGNHPEFTWTIAREQKSSTTKLG